MYTCKGGFFMDALEFPGKFEIVDHIFLSPPLYASTSMYLAF